MAFTREFVRNIAKECEVELPKEFINALMDEHITARDAYAKEQVEAAEKNAPSAQTGDVKDSDEYKNLKKSFDDYKAEVTAKETKAKKEAAYRAILKDANLTEKGIEKAIKYADWNKVELESDGKIKSASDLIKSAKEEWAEYVTTTTVTGAQTSNPPGGNVSPVKTKEEIYKMENGKYVLSASERQAELAKLYQNEQGE